MSATYFIYAILDFKVAIRDSFLSHFSNIEAKGCSFHFIKAIISKVSHNGFKSDYSNKEGICNLYLLAKQLTGKQRAFSVQMINYML